MLFTRSYICLSNAERLKFPSIPSHQRSTINDIHTKVKQIALTMNDMLFKMADCNIFDYDTDIEADN